MANKDSSTPGTRVERPTQRLRAARPPTDVPPLSRSTTMDTLQEIGSQLGNPEETWKIAEARPTIQDLPQMAGGTGTYQFHLRRDRPVAPGDGSARVMTTTDQGAPTSASIKVTSAAGDVLLHVGTLKIRCSPATAAWLAQALTDAARNA